MGQEVHHNFIWQLNLPGTGKFYRINECENKNLTRKIGNSQFIQQSESRFSEMEILAYLMEQVLPSAAQGASELHDGFADVLLHGDQGFLGAEPGALRGDDVQEVRLAVDVQGAGEKEGFSVGVVFLVQVLHLGGVVAVGNQSVFHLLH